MKSIAVLICILVSWRCEAFEWIAHRGNARDAIENSIAGVTASWAVGADAIELDVRVSKDEIVYLFHDDEIDGTLVSDLTYTEIEQLASSERVPRLETVLSIGNPAGLYLLDLKAPTVHDIERIAPIILNASMPVERIAVQSDNLVILRRANKSLPDCQYFYLERLSRTPPFYVPPSPEKILKKLTGINIHGISIKGRQFFNADYIESLKSSGLRIYVWTINDSDRAEYYRRIGVDGVITDQVEEMRKNATGFIANKLLNVTDHSQPFLRCLACSLRKSRLQLAG